MPQFGPGFDAGALGRYARPGNPPAKVATLFARIAIQRIVKPMTWKHLPAIATAWATLLVLSANAGDLRITLPKRSHPTPVQRLNQQGVEAIRKNQFDKAKALFYKAYLYDPDDPFTLNNLGYISELEGQVERAQRFYALAAEHSTDAVIDRASARRVEGKSIRDVVANLTDNSMQINRQNVEAIRLLSQGRAAEAEDVVKQTLAMDPRNAFALNNMGVVKEMEGELEEAEKYYGQAAASHSEEPVIVTLNRVWRGKPVSEMAADNARKVREQLDTQEDIQARGARLNLRGVSAVNRNDWTGARNFFQQAYRADPTNAFSLNNYGFLSEMDGDEETAQLFYEKARRAERANVPVGYATRRSAEGKPLFQIAGENDQKADNQIAQERLVRMREGGPIQLKRRDNTPVVEPQAPPASPPPQAAPGLGPPQPPIPQLTPPNQPPPSPQPPNQTDQPQ